MKPSAFRAISTWEPTPAGSESYIFSVTAQATGEDAFYTSINAVIERSSNADGVVSRKLTVKTASKPDGEFTAALAAGSPLTDNRRNGAARRKAIPIKLSGETGTAAKRKFLQHDPLPI